MFGWRLGTTCYPRKEGKKDNVMYWRRSESRESKCGWRSEVLDRDGGDW